jgi:hypothetical protein
VRAGEAKHVAQIMNQQQARLDRALLRFAVYTKLDFHAHGTSEHLQAKSLGAQTLRLPRSYFKTPA